MSTADAGEGEHSAPLDILSAAEPYFVEAAVAEFVQFEGRFAALVWLHHALSSSVAREVRALRALRESGRHRVPGWEGESDLVLDESTAILEQDAAQISSGAIIAACSSALESLLIDLLPEPSSRREAPQGLVPKARALIAKWPDAQEAATLQEHVKWLAKRRNSFAHRLIDEGGPWDTAGTRYEFDDEVVEETFERVGEAATILSLGYDEYVTRRNQYGGAS